MSFLLLPVINRIDVLINRIERLIAATTGVPVDELPPEIIIPTPEIVISQPMLPNRYKLFRLDLTEDHTDESIGIGSMLRDVGALYASYMSILTEPNAFTFKLNSTDMDEIDAAVGVEQKDFEITEIFYSNTGVLGSDPAILNIEYRVD